MPGTVVVGAHYDTKDIPGFVGANDGASGVAVVLELARALPPRLAGPSDRSSSLFDARGGARERDFERDGDRGSRQYVAYARAGGGQGSPPLDRIRAMVLFDMVGDCDLQIPREANSDPDALRAVRGRRAPSSRRPEPFAGTTAPVADDHIPFLDAGDPGGRPDRLHLRLRARRPARTGTRPRTRSTRSARRASTRSARRPARDPRIR